MCVWPFTYLAHTNILTAVKYQTSFLQQKAKHARGWNEGGGVDGAFFCDRGNLMKRERHEDRRRVVLKRYREVKQMDLQDVEGRDRWIEETERFTDGRQQNASVNLHEGRVHSRCPRCCGSARSKPPEGHPWFSELISCMHQ